MIKFLVSVLQGQHFPLGGLETFCNGRLLYSPLFTDLSSSCVASDLSPPVLSSLYPMVALAKPALLCELGTVELLPCHTPQEKKLLGMLRMVLKEFEGAETSIGRGSTEMQSILFGGGVVAGEEGGGGEVGKEGVKALERISKTLIFSLSLSIWTLQGSTLKDTTPLVCTHIHTALATCAAIWT